VAAALYLAVAVLSVTYGLLGGRPLYDGIPLAPYRWVNPPEARLKDNEAPMPAEVVTEFKASGYPEDSATTPDNQVTVIVSGSLDQTEYLPTGESNTFRYTITPLDPAAVGPKPPGRFFDGNAYRIDAYYPSGRPVEAGTFDVILSYAVHATDIRRWDGSEWTHLEGAYPQREQYQIYSPSSRLGIFVPTGDGDVPKDVPTQNGAAGTAPKKSRVGLGFTAMGLAASIAAATAFLARRRKESRPPVRKGSRTPGKGKPIRADDDQGPFSLPGVGVGRSAVT
jgi:hypothetical protein